MRQLRTGHHRQRPCRHPRSQRRGCAQHGKHRHLCRTAGNRDSFREWLQYNDLEPSAPIIIAIDEAQNFRRDPEDPLAKLLQEIHLGSTGLPVTLVLAGLGDTCAAADRMGLTRIPAEQTHNIGRFPQSDVDTLMLGFGRRFQIDTQGSDLSGTRLIGDCERWPRHLHTALSALGKAAVDADGDLIRMDWPRAERHAAEMRDLYYRGQYSEEMRIAKRLTAQVMRNLDSINSHSEIRREFWRLNKSDPHTYCFPKDWGANRFFEHLLHRGALHEEDVDRFVCPIPSFRSYLLAHCGDPEPDSTPSDDTSGGRTGATGCGEARR